MQRKKTLLDKLKCRESRGAVAANVTYWFVVLMYLELVLHCVVFGVPDADTGLVIVFSFVFAGVLALTTSLLPKKLWIWITGLLTLFLILLYGSQTVYYFIFGTLYTVAQIQQGGAAITSFWKETLLVMGNHLPWLTLLLVPAILPALFGKRIPAVFSPTNWAWWVLLLTAVLIAQGIAVACVNIFGTGYFSNHYVYNSASATMDQTTERFGLLTAFRLDIQGKNESSKQDEEIDYYVPEQTQPVSTETTPTETQVLETHPQDVQPEIIPTEPPNPYNALDIDFAMLDSMTEDKKILALNRYFSSLTGTGKNEYTGMLKDYNLIALCAESFSSGAIHKELTPTLYMLANEGIIFNNYYTTFPNNTTDGEYTYCMGLYPDMSRGKTISSFYASRNSYLPYCLGNVFKEQRGVDSYAYHNYFGSYYGRDESHPNMGYRTKFANDGMDFGNAWPSSDLEMMKQSVDDYISADQQFHAYYMTFSGHLAYDIQTNPMAYRNWELVKDLPYSYEAKCYLSCNIELDKALAYLLERLEEAGVADKTAIVLASDHHPYGLTDDQYFGLLRTEPGKFYKFRSNLIFWVGGLEEPIVVDEYCCSVDVLPTILNLWGFEFDSRMLVGTDVFSDGTHVAVLSDKSFFTEKVWVNTEHGIIKYLVDKKELPQDYVDNMLRLIETKFALSADILNCAYYNFVFEKGEVAVNRYSWE